MNITHSSTRFVALAAAVAVASVLFLGAAVTPAKAALTQTQINSIISLLQSFGADATTIANVQASLTGGTPSGGGSSTGGSSAACYAWTRDLTVGSSGADVMALQVFLNANGAVVAASGAGSPGNETMTFGPLTRSALAKWQAANGVSPAAGYFGPITRAAIAAKCSASPGTPGGGGSTGGGPLQGGAGSIGDADFVSGLQNEEVGEDEEDVEVAGLEIEADGSDIELTAVGITFDEGTGSTDDFEDYATEVSIWFNGEEVARVDADEFQDDDDWNTTISLDSGAIIREGDTGELVVAVSGQSNLDNDQTADEWDVAFESVRFRDAQNAVITDNSTGDIDSTIPAGTTSRTFSFESFATAADVELHLSAGDDTINDSRTITIDDSDDTNDVEVLSFMMEAEGNSDLEIKDLGVNFDVTGESHVDDVIAGGTNPAIRLMIDGEEYGDATYEDDGDDIDVGTDEDVLFEEVDYILDAGDEVEVLIVVDLLSTGDGLGEGSTIAVNVGETETDQATLWDVEDESGEDLADGDVTGSATGEAHSLYENGIRVEAVSTDADANDDDTIGTFQIVIDVTAFGEDQYVHKLADTASSTDAGFYYTIYESGAATSTFFGSASDLVTTTADEDGEYFVIDEGSTERFTLTVTLDPTSTTRLYNVELDSLRFDPDNAADSASTEDTYYTVPDSEDVETDPVSLDAS
jgi:peptidoglycan hydrolase-like protein with peptidoglycan-binding domain